MIGGEGCVGVGWKDRWESESDAPLRAVGRCVACGGTNSQHRRANLLPGRKTTAKPLVNEPRSELPVS